MKVTDERIAVVIPCYKVKKHILPLIKKIGKDVWRIYVVDDCCPEQSGSYVSQNCKDKRVIIVQNPKNLGVGGAVMSGYAKAIEDGASVIVKLDGDGQMDPDLLMRFVKPIIEKRADYTKGNRFYNIQQIKQMPGIRIFGNAVLSFLSKLSTGYWSIFDPTNGYTAIDARVAKMLPVEKISKRYFFETDMLFRLNTLRAKVQDIPMDPLYGDEVSGLKISKILFEFMYKHIRNIFKRIFYNYFLRDMSIASFELVFGIGLFMFGSVFGILSWIESVQIDKIATSGTVMLSALPVIVGLQFILNFFSFDFSNQPVEPIHDFLDY